VEDDEIALNAISHLLRRNGWKVLQARSGAECFAEVDAHHPDLILLDLKLPDINGIDVLKRLRANPAYDDIFIVHLSAQASPAKKRREALDHGADGYISQPIENPELVSAVRGFLRLKARLDALRRKESSHLRSELSALRQEVATLARLKDTFHGMASHNLRKPVTGILMTADLLLDPENSREEHRMMVRSVKDAGNRVIKQLNDFLDMAEIEAGEFRLAKVPSNLFTLVFERLPHHRHHAEAKGIELREELRGDLPELLVDPDRVMQVLDNLVENGIKYTTRGGAVIVRLFAADQCAVLSVQDTGPGMSGTQIQNLFSNSRPSPEPLTAGERSPGVGLMIVKAIVDAHNGQISVQSQQGEGSTFIVRLPINANAR
jgi:signal transduction histidine kinase